MSTSVIIAPLSPESAESDELLTQNTKNTGRDQIEMSLMSFIGW
jgi:hypothetical protein